MALLKPYKGLSSQLNSLPIREGQLIVTTDDNAFYLDASNNERIRLDAEYVVVDTLPEENIDKNKIYLIDTQEDSYTPSRGITAAEVQQMIDATIAEALRGSY